MNSEIIEWMICYHLPLNSIGRMKGKKRTYLLRLENEKDTEWRRE